MRLDDNGLRLIDWFGIVAGKQSTCAIAAAFRSAAVFARQGTSHRPAIADRWLRFLLDAATRLS
jgi:hypothetical protein